MPDARRAQPHPARAERVARAGRDGLEPLRPGVLGRRVPPRVPPLDDDLEMAQRRRVDRLSGGDREDPHEADALVEVEAVGAAVDHDHRRRLAPRRPGASAAVRRSPSACRVTIASRISIRVGNVRSARPGCACVKNGRLCRRITLPATGARYVLRGERLHPLRDELHVERRGERDGRVRGSRERRLDRGADGHRRVEVVRRDRATPVADVQHDAARSTPAAPRPSPGSAVSPPTSTDPIWTPSAITAGGGVPSARAWPAPTPRAQTTRQRMKPARLPTGRRGF